MSRHNYEYVIWVSEPSREHLEHEGNNPKVNIWCTLTHGSIIDPFFFDEDIVTGSSFPDMLENYAFPQLNNNLIQLDNVPVHFAHTVRD